MFSTGPILDSLFCSGSVMDAYSHKIEMGITVMLYHDKDDSLPFKKLPDYFAKTDEQGNFTIKNISPGTYKLVALNDKNNNYRCDNPQEEAIAFADSAIDVSNRDVKMLQLFTQAPGKLFVKKAMKEANGGVIISFSKPVENLSWKMISQTTTADNLTLIASPILTYLLALIHHQLHCLSKEKMFYVFLLDLHFAVSLMQLLQYRMEYGCSTILILMYLL